MARSDNATGKEDGGRQESGFRRESRPDQAEPREEERDHRGGEDFEESLDPEMHNPPAPVFDKRQVRMLSPRQTRSVEEADRGRRHDEQPQQRFVFGRRFERRPDRPDDEEEPDEQPYQQQNLPAAPEIDIFIALVAPHERSAV